MVWVADDFVVEVFSFILFLLVLILFLLFPFFYFSLGVNMKDCFLFTAVLGRLALQQTSLCERAFR